MAFLPVSIASLYFGAGLDTPTCANAASKKVVMSGALIVIIRRPLYVVLTVLARLATST
jgi:hypothetical protein